MVHLLEGDVRLVETPFREDLDLAAGFFLMALDFSFNSEFCLL